MRSIQVRELCRLMESSQVDLVDVRTPAEYQTVRVAQAVNVPLDRLDPAALLAGRNGRSNEPLYVICKSGGRSAQACQKLMAAGLSNVVNVEGGTSGWENAGLPVTRGGRKVLPMDRQMQITVGVMALVGMALGWFVHPGWFVLPTMVGFGLLMAGLSGFCPLALLISRMPWNQGSTSCAAASCCATGKGN